MNTFYVIIITFIIINNYGCADVSHRNWSSQQAVTKNIPFQARPIQDQLKQRMLILPWEVQSELVTVDLKYEATNYFNKQISLTENYVLVTPEEIGIEFKNFLKTDLLKDKSQNITNLNFNRSFLDWDKLLSYISQKGVAIVVQGFLENPKEIESIDPVGIVRTLRWEKEVSINIKIYDPRRKKEIWSRSVKNKTSDKELKWLIREGERTHLPPQPEVLSDLVKLDIDQLIIPMQETLSQFKWNGRLALVKGDRIYLNVGRMSGLQVGDLLRVFDEKGEEIFDPESGDSIGKAPGNMKGTLEVISYFGQDGAIAVVHSGAGFQENDLVELYQ